ncbi:hypothetical protein ONZ45_g4512 [Pleurotus djamor]|nr:hypothetical protein ONZ45_g4512 [Pleurotus djamor]
MWLLPSTLWSTLLVSAGIALGAPSLPENAVNLGYVKYQGVRSLPNTNAFLGIPFAEPPVGHRRFRAPTPLNTLRVALEAHGQIVDATEYAPACVQANGSGQEDCLTLNVWAPAGAKKGDNLPVLVYIHGGGYDSGTPSGWKFDHWVEQSPNLIIVSASYRLGLFGFLAEPRFSNPLYGDFNQGFKDQILALKWVKKYISSFGGDPNTITINGHSAGANSILLHLVSKQTDKVFHRAIAQSVWRATLATPAQYQPLFDYIATHVGCTNSVFLLKMACMRQVTTAQLVAAASSVSTSFTGQYFDFVPIFDSQLFTEYPTESLVGGRYADVPLIVGATTNDTIANAPDIVSEFTTWWPQVTSASVDAILSMYPASDYPAPDYRHRAINADCQFICPRSQLGTIFSASSAAWTYRHNERNAHSSFPRPIGSVGHADENWYFFLKPFNLIRSCHALLEWKKLPVASL